MKDQRYFPLFVDLSEKKVFVVGGGTIAERRVRSLLDFAGMITIVSPEITEELQKLLKYGELSEQHTDPPIKCTESSVGHSDSVLKRREQFVERVEFSKCVESAGRTVLWVRRKYEPEDITGFDLVLACTNDPELNKKITAEARAAGIPANNCSDRTDCDFLFPGLSVKGSVTVGITAGGRNHHLVKEIRERTDALLDDLDTQKAEES